MPDQFSRFDKAPTCDGQTDRQTDRGSQLAQHRVGEKVHYILMYISFLCISHIAKCRPIFSVAGLSQSVHLRQHLLGSTCNFEIFCPEFGTTFQKKVPLFLEIREFPFGTV